MKKGIITLCVIATITAVCWAVTPPADQAAFVYHLTQLIGALSLTGFACTLIISTRIPPLDDLFGGLDKAYVVHKWIGIGSIGLVIAHFAVLVAARVMGTISAELTPLGQIGMPGMLLFTILGLTALIAKKMKYEQWKTIHKFMLFPFVIGIIHYYGSSSFDPYGLNPFSIWMSIVNVLGLIAGVYSIFMYEGIAFPFRYTVTSVKTVANKTFEITGEASGKHMAYKAGQFTFLKVPRGSARFSSHPFTVSMAPNDNILQFTIKSSGDGTAELMERVKVDDIFAVSAPHGRFDYTAGGKNQIWIGGGIGITPFRSFYQTDIPAEFSIDFFYAYTGEDGAYLDELKDLNKRNLRVHLTDSKKQGRLTIDKIKDTINTQLWYDVYFCGPKPMRDSLREGLKNSDINVLGFHFEEFTFGR